MANTGDALAITQLVVNLPSSHQLIYWSCSSVHALLQGGEYLDNFPIQTIPINKESSFCEIHISCSFRRLMYHEIAKAIVIHASTVDFIAKKMKC